MKIWESRFIPRKLQPCTWIPHPPVYVWAEADLIPIKWKHNMYKSRTAPADRTRRVSFLHLSFARPACSTSWLLSTILICFSRLSISRLHFSASSFRRYTSSANVLKSSRRLVNDCISATLSSWAAWNALEESIIDRSEWGAFHTEYGIYDNTAIC